MAWLGIYQNAELIIFFLSITLFLSNFSVYLLTPVLKMRNSAKPGNVSQQFSGMQKIKLNMKIKLKANLPITKEYKTLIGDLTIKNFEIVKFEKTENFAIVEHFNNKIYPIKRSEFEVKFLDEFDEESKMFSALIKIKDSLKVGVNLNWFEKIKLKWILKMYRIQNPENQWKFIIYITATIISIIGLIYTIKRK